MRDNKIWLVMVLCITIIGKNILRANTEKGLIGWWSFDEIKDGMVEDKSGNNNDGKVHGAEIVSGVLGSGLKFDGKDDYVDIPQIKEVGNSFTVEFWIYPLSILAGNQVISAGHHAS